MFRKRKQVTTSKFEEFRPIIAKNKEIYIRERYIPDEIILSHFEKAHGYRFDLDHPVTFNEKLAARKRDDNPLFSRCADKIAVRDYVKKHIGSNYLVPMYYSGRQLPKRIWKKLPNSFVAKTNNGSGTVDIIRDKNQIQYEDLYAELDDWLGIEFEFIDGEMFYGKIHPRILIEELLLDENGNVPKDFKIHCFNGAKKRKLIEVDYDRFSHHTTAVYDEEFNKLDVQLGYEKYDGEDKPPKNLEEMIYVSDVLSREFDYVRVDLYSIHNKIYFGELTFCHHGGAGIIAPNSYDRLWGEWW